MKTQDTNQVKLSACYYLLGVIRPIVDHPEEIKVTATTDHLGLHINIDSHLDDRDILIGQSGSVAAALRRLMQLWGRRNTAVVNIFVPGTKGKEKLL
ncbi:MAG: KH domain-containing protein [Patescibacteria group bacterium]|nr:KH domain-containing protein [Patescibacteria group bacterium]